MNLTLTRYRIKSDHIDGHLSSEFGTLCDTLENSSHSLQAGTYRIIIVKCNQHSRKKPIICIDGNLTPQCDKCNKLADVCNNTSMPCFCPQITPGNGAHNRKDGAILVGTYNTSGSLVHPKQAFDNVYDILRKNNERGHDLTLTIVEDYPEPKHKELSNFEMGEQILRQF